MKIQATFVGENSLGYEKGVTYRLKLISFDRIRREDGSGICAYDTIIAFLNNWDNIKVLNK
jgi:hypothetical protein